MANFQSLKMDHLADYDSSEVAALRADLALALRAASMHGLSEGVCNHFSVELPDGSGRFLLNPQGFLWSELQGVCVCVCVCERDSSCEVTGCSELVLVRAMLAHMTCILILHPPI